MERSDKQRVLVVDDDREIVAAIVRLLEREGIETIAAYNGREAVERLTENEIHLIIIDIMMPEMDGISATIKIRTERNIPVIMLSAKTEESDKILGLSVGADDYVTKPFSPAELIARVKSQLRRYMTLGDYANRSGGSDVALGGLLLHRDQRQLDVDGEPVKLTPKEYRIVELLMSNPGRVFSAEEIYERVWNGDGVFGRKYDHGAYPQDTREDRDKSERAEIFKGGVGNWIQNGENSAAAGALRRSCC